ncbi:hypothetical protein ACFFHK_00730 [Gallibacterium trehalosifermentans]|uniref:Transcriptional regulator n=1 Tax=Gallibacterium trehalosifermentans TaxID=516935 RepID=A0ABV6H0B2_9PAST
MTEIETLMKVGQTLCGQHWQADMMKDLKLSDTKRIRGWLTGKQIPNGIWKDLSKLLKDKQNDINTLLAILDKTE